MWRGPGPAARDRVRLQRGVAGRRDRPRDRDAGRCGRGAIDTGSPVAQRGGMPYYRRVGDIPRKRHTQFRKPDGSLYAEELMGVEGFSSDSALLYHEHAPTAILDAVAIDETAQSLAATPSLKPRHIKTKILDAPSSHLVTGRQPLLGN